MKSKSRLILSSVFFVVAFFVLLVVGNGFTIALAFSIVVFLFSYIFSSDSVQNYLDEDSKTKKLKREWEREQGAREDILRREEYARERGRLQADKDFNNRNEQGSIRRGLWEDSGYRPAKSIMSGHSTLANPYKKWKRK